MLLVPSLLYCADSGGNINIIVTSAKESKVGAVRHAFQSVFGRATVTGVVSINDSVIHYFSAIPCAVVLPAVLAREHCLSEHTGRYWQLYKLLKTPFYSTTTTLWLTSH